MTPRKHPAEGGWYEADEAGLSISLYRKDVSTMAYVRIPWRKILRAAKRLGKL